MQSWVPWHRNRGGRSFPDHKELRESHELQCKTDRLLASSLCSALLCFQAMALQVLSSGLGSVKKAAPEAQSQTRTGVWETSLRLGDPRNRVTQRETPLEKNLREA